jgi:hypothetical protein
MRALCWILPLLAVCAAADEATDRADIARTIVVFNDPARRLEILEPNADVPDLRHCARAEVSQIFLQVKAVRFVTPDVALADASATQYGTMILKHSTAAVFILKREGAVWKIDSLRIPESCLAIVPVR